ncbi:MAG TPA: Gfo/Idh/MocA family oxidoreductase, partial [Vicinamibacterales bacterium]|nr:Gfo/Idh/MocA family oxidoreductase [Vicinamibacterales bacterium]
MTVSRRRFLAQSGLLAAGTLVSRAAAGQPRRRPQRVAVIGVGHYHAFSPPNYLAILQSEQVDIVGVHDPDAAIAAKYAAQVGSTPYTDYRTLIEKTRPEFVIALGHHAAMPAPFRFLVEAGVPFLMEK